MRTRLLPATKRWTAAFALIAAVCGHAFAAEAGKPAPAVALPELQSGQPFELAALRGRVVLLDFWASWCGPCRESLPLYQKLRDEFPRTDFEVVAVNVDDEKQDALAFLERIPLQFPLLHDEGGKVAAAYALKGMPSSYLIDRDGNVASRHVGFQRKDLAPLREHIVRLIGEAHDAH
jgi:thiol-disulfide isomerase/thioredoxin